MEAYLNRVEVHPGSVLHSCGHGSCGGRRCDVDGDSAIQRRDYRFYDWNRVAENGDERPLHIQKGLDVLKSALSLQKCTGELRRE